MFKEKLLAQLVVLNPGVSKIVLGLFAAQLAAKVTEESQIEGAISDFTANNPTIIKETADAMQREGDRRVTDALKPKPVVTPPVETPAAPASENESPTDKLLKTLLEKVTKLETEKSQTSIKSKFLEAVGKDVPQSILDLVSIPATEEEIEPFAERVKANWTSIKQSEANSGMGGDKPNGAQGGPSAGAKPASKEELDSVMNNLKI